MGFLWFILARQSYLSYSKFKTIKNLDAQTVHLEENNNLLRQEIDYFKNPANLEKEARSVLNYKRPDEKMAIIVDNPQNQNPTATPFLSR